MKYNNKKKSIHKHELLNVKNERWTLLRRVIDVNSILFLTSSSDSFFIFHCTIFDFSMLIVYYNDFRPLASRRLNVHLEILVNAVSLELEKLPFDFSQYFIFARCYEFQMIFLIVSSLGLFSSLFNSSYLPFVNTSTPFIMYIIYMCGFMLLFFTSALFLFLVILVILPVVRASLATRSIEHT